MEIGELQSKNEVFEELARVVVFCLDSILEETEKIDYIYSNVGFPLTEESYLEILNTYSIIKNILREVRFLSIPVYKTFKCEKKHDAIRKEVEELDCCLRKLRGIIKKISKNVDFNLKELNDVPYKKIYKTNGNPNCYNRLDDILKEAIFYGYPYSLYYDLAVESLSKQRFLSKERLRIVEENNVLENNDKDVVKRNGNNEAILSLYDSELLFGYRGSLLEEMQLSGPDLDLDKDLQDIIKLETINHVLTIRNKKNIQK